MTCMFICFSQGKYHVEIDGTDQKGGPMICAEAECQV